MLNQLRGLLLTNRFSPRHTDLQDSGESSCDLATEDRESRLSFLLQNPRTPEGVSEGVSEGVCERVSRRTLQNPLQTPSRTIRKPCKKVLKIDDALRFLGLKNQCQGPGVLWQEMKVLNLEMRVHIKNVQCEGHGNHAFLNHVQQTASGTHPHSILQSPDTIDWTLLI